MKQQILFSVALGIAVVVIVILVGFFILEDILEQLEDLFAYYCSEQNETVGYIANVTCLPGHQYCYVICSNGVSMDEWLGNVTWAGGKR